jgi:hypothetical protein
MSLKDHKELAKEYREGKHEFKHPANRIKLAEMHEHAGSKSKALHKAKGEHSVDYSIRKGTSKGLSYNEAGKEASKRLSQGKKY